jgi:hypothetical protein
MHAGIEYDAFASDFETVTVGADFDVPGQVGKMHERFFVD